MATETPVETVKSLYDAFMRGDIGFIIDRLADDVRWVTHVESIVPWSGDKSGKTRVPEFFNAIAQAVDVLSFEAEQHVAEGDTVVSIGTFGCRVRATGKTSHTRWAFVWKIDINSGKVTSYEQFHDPALANAFR